MLWAVFAVVASSVIDFRDGEKEAAGSPKRTGTVPYPGTQGWQVVMDQTGASQGDAGTQAPAPSQLPRGLVDSSCGP